jgi:hypothetical protein
MYLKNLRKLYGRSGSGSNRRTIKITLTPESLGLLEQLTEVGKGRNGSAVIELSLRLLIALVTSGENVDVVALELDKACDSPYLVNNIKRLARLMERYE